MASGGFGGGGGGGGFMPESSMMDTSFGASSQGPPKRESSGNGRVVPVTALMIQRAASRKQSEGDEFVINGQVVKQVKLLGMVQEIKETQTNASYTLNDASGALIEVKRWMNVGGGAKEQDLRAEVREGMYCWVVGNLRSFSDTPHISCYVIVPAKTKNEITRHILEVVYAHLAMTRANEREGNTSVMQVEPSGVGGRHLGAGVAQIHSGLSDIQRELFEVLRSCHNEDGLHISAIITKIGSRYTEPQIRAAADFLCAEGLAYNSTDEDYFKSTE